MAKAIQEVVVKLVADTKGLNQGLTKATRTTKNFGKKAANDMQYFKKSIISAKAALIGSAGIVIALGLAATKFAAMGAAAIMAGDEIGKMSSKLGITAEELQEYQIVADAAGVSTETFNMAFQRFTRRVGEVKNGTGELKTTFEALDISVRDANGNFRSTTDLFREFGTKIADVDDVSQQLAFTMKGMDSEGVALINMFKLSIKEQDELIAKAKEYGAVISNEVIASMEEYSTELGLINKGTKALSLETDAALAGWTLKWASLKNEAIKYFNVLAVGMGADNNIKTATHKLKLLEDQLQNLKDKADDESWLSSMTGFGASQMKRMTASVADARLELELLQAVAEETANNKQVDPEAPSATKPQLDATATLTYYEKLEQAARDYTAEVENAWEATEQADIAFQNGTITAEEYARIQEDINKVLLENVEATDALAESTTEVAAVTRTASQTMADNWMDSTARMDDAFASAMSNSADALTDFVMTGKLSFADLANSIIADLIRIQIRQQIVGMLGAGLGNISTASQFGTNVGSQQTSMIQAQNAGFAGGGRVQPHSLQMVGERGPELLRMGASGGSVVNNSDASGSGSIPVTVSIKNEGTAQTPSSATASMKPDGLVVEVVLNDLRRDGPISQGMKKTFRVSR